MKRLILIAMLALAASPVLAQTQTFTRDDGTIQHVMSVTQPVCQMQSQTNLGNAAIGAGVGYATGQIASNVLGTRSSTGSLLGAAAGALIGANTQKKQECVYVNEVVGYNVLTFRNGNKVSEEFVPIEKIRQQR